MHRRHPSARPARGGRRQEAPLEGAACAAGVQPDIFLPGPQRNFSITQTAPSAAAFSLPRPGSPAAPRRAPGSPLPTTAPPARPAAPPGRLRRGTLCKCNLSAGPASARKQRAPLPGTRGGALGAGRRPVNQRRLTENQAARAAGRPRPLSLPAPPSPLAARSLFVPPPPASPLLARASLRRPEPLHHAPFSSPVLASSPLLPLLPGLRAPRSPPPARSPQARFLSFRRAESTRKEVPSHPSSPAYRVRAPLGL